MDRNEAQMAARERRAHEMINRRTIVRVGIPMTLAIAALSAAIEKPPLEYVVNAWDSARPVIGSTLQRVFTDEPRMYGGDLAYFTQMADVYREGVNQVQQPEFEAMQDYVRNNPAFAESLPDDVLGVYFDNRDR